MYRRHLRLDGKQSLVRLTWIRLLAPGRVSNFINKTLTSGQA